MLSVNPASFHFDLRHFDIECCYIAAPALILIVLNHIDFYSSYFVIFLSQRKDRLHTFTIINLFICLRCNGPAHNVQWPTQEIFWCFKWPVCLSYCATVLVFQGYLYLVLCISPISVMLSNPIRALRTAMLLWFLKQPTDCAIYQLNQYYKSGDHSMV